MSIVSVHADIGSVLFLVTVDCFPVSGICCNGQVHTGSSVGFKRKLPCKWTLVHSCLLQVLINEHVKAIRIAFLQCVSKNVFNFILNILVQNQPILILLMHKMMA